MVTRKLIHFKDIEIKIINDECERGGDNFTVTARRIIREWAELKQQQERDTKESQADHA